MLRSITIRQLEEWRAYSDLEPWDEERADLRAASIVLELRNLFGRKKGQPGFKLKDCVVRFGDQRGEAPRTPEQARANVMATMSMLMAIHNIPPPKKKGNR